LKRIYKISLILIFAAVAAAFNPFRANAMERAAGYCENGAVSVTVGGLPSAPQKVQGSYPNCTVTVYQTGTLTLATLYSDNAATPTPLSNPFTSSSDGSWFFYAVNGRYDVRLSGGTPPSIPTPFTRADVLLCDPASATGTLNCSGGASGSDHNLLSTTHLDTIPASPPTRGDIITAQNQTSPTGVNPSWARLPLGADTYVLTSNGTDAIWAPASSASCPLGAADTRYVDSTSGSDSNTGRNWCSAYATEGAAVTALTGTGGWVYVAPNYTGTAASSVPANIHILETNQFDAVSPSVRRFSFPDWTDDTQDILPTLTMNTATPSSTATVLAANHAFGEDFEDASIVGSTLVPSTSASFDNAIGVLGVADAQGQQTQSSGVEGICYSEFNATDCTGTVGLATSSAAAQTTTSLEGGWFQVWPKTTVNNVDGVVVRGTTSNMPLTDAGPNLPTAAFDIRGSGTLEQTWLHGLYMEDWTVWQPIYLGLQKNPDTGTVPDRGNNGILFAWQYDLSIEETSQLRVTGSTSALYPYGGDFQFVNNHANGTASTATVTVQTNATGYVSVDAINPVAFSATANFDRSLGKIQKTTLTGDMTAPTLSNCAAGQTVIFDIVEDGTGGHAFTPPANLHGFGSITTTADFHNRQMFYCDGSSSNSGGYSVGAMQSGT
jgi:hypothetical protein